MTDRKARSNRDKDNDRATSDNKYINTRANREKATFANSKRKRETDKYEAAMDLLDEVDQMMLDTEGGDDGYALDGDFH